MNQQLIQQMLLNKLKNQNPDGYNQIISLMKSGENPNNILNNLRRNGTVTDAQINQAQEYLNMFNQNRKTF